MIRKRFIFRGRVQGVGFRYTAVRAARIAGVTGWVRNEYDGSVVLEAQGERDQIDRLVIAIDNPYIEIMDVQYEIVTIVPDEHGFSVR